MNADLSILETVTLTHGKHAAGGSVCAMEAIACALGLPHSATPPCTDAPLAAVVQRVNDWNGWESDEARTVYLRPYLMRLGRLAIAGKRAPDAAYGYAAADVACRVIAPAAMDRANLPEQAASLRALAPIVSRETADAAAAASAAYGAAAHAAASAAYGAAAYGTAVYAAYGTAVYAAYGTADYAASAAYGAAAHAAAYGAAAHAAAAAAYGTAAYAAYGAAAYAAHAAESTYRKGAGALLDRMLDVCEAGAWPQP